VIELFPSEIRKGDFIDCTILPRTPFLGQGANQALQDAYCLARLIAEYNALAPTSRPLVASIASQYEKRRKWHTAKLTWKSRLVGFMETLGGPVGTFVKFNFFRVLGRLGLAEEELLNAAIPIL
jgi:2-polyprenyl-6-methoxyphenol hydroxylase-like FAD-dependent oxidoreductase